MVYPFLIFINAHLLTENLFLLLFALFIYYNVRYIQENNIKWLILSLIAISLLSVCRSAFSYFFIFYAYYLYKCFGYKVLVFLPLAFIFAALWGLRNYYVYNKFIYTSTSTGVHLTVCYNDSTFFNKKYLGNYITAVDPAIPMVDEGSEVADDDKRIAIVKNYLKKNWKRLPVVALFRVVNLFHYAGRHPDKRTFLMDLIGIVTYFWMLPFYFALLFINFKKTEYKLFIIITLYVISISIITCGTTRFRLPIDLIMLVVIPHGLIIVSLYIKNHFRVLERIKSK